MLSSPVLGVDCSSTVMAYVGSKGLPQGCVEPKSKDANLRRLEMFQAAQDITAHLQYGTVIAMEEPISLRNPKTNVILSMAAGAVWAGFASLHQVILIPISTWKKNTVGNGNAKKEQVREWVLQHPEFDGPLSYYDKHPDMWDAWAIYRYALENLQPSVLR